MARAPVRRATRFGGGYTWTSALEARAGNQSTAVYAPISRGGGRTPWDDPTRRATPRHVYV